MMMIIMAFAYDGDDNDDNSGVNDDVQDETYASENEVLIAHSGYHDGKSDRLIRWTQEKNYI